MVKTLLEGGANVNIPDRHGNNAIHLAVKHVTIACLRVLLETSKVKQELDAKNFEGALKRERSVVDVDCNNFEGALSGRP